jgi:hypothetical protein
VPSISPAISQRSQGLSWGHSNQVVCLLAFRLWPARGCAQATACAPLPAWLRGEFDAAGSHLEAATADFASASDHHQIEAVWFQPDDPIATAYLHLALTCLVRGDLTDADADAEAELAYVARRVEALGFPQGPYSHAYARFVESWLRIEAGQLDRAGALAAELTELAERRGLDHWRRTGSIQQVVVGALAALDADDFNPTARSARTATITRFVDTWRTAEEYMYLTFFDSVLGRLLTAASQPQVARERLDTGLQLTQDTGMRFYDAELLRLRAHTHPDARRADITGALALARRQGATLFELRAALDDFELRGEPARGTLVDVASRISTNNTWPELARAQAALSEQS